MHTCLEQEITLKKDIRLHFNCEIYFSVHFFTCFLHLQTSEMPSCGISSGYALFVKVKKISGQKMYFLVADENDKIQVSADIAPLK